MATTPARNFNLVVPLANKVTAMRITETAGNDPERSGAVSQLIGHDLRLGDVDSTTATPGTRTSTMAIRTTTSSGFSTEHLLADSASVLCRYVSSIEDGYIHLPEMLEPLEDLIVRVQARIEEIQKDQSNG